MLQMTQTATGIAEHVRQAKGVHMSERVIKIGGLAGLLAAALFVVNTVITQIAGVRIGYVSPADYLAQAVNLVAFLAVVVAIVGVQALLARTAKLRRLGLVGAWLAGIGYAVMALINAYNLVQGERSLGTIRIGAAGVLLVGSVILGIVVLVTRLLPWWCGVLLIVAFPLGDVANGLFGGAEGILLALLWGTVGAGLLTRATAPVEWPVGQPAKTR